MDFTKLIGLELFHNIYGRLKVTNVEVNPYDIADTKVITEGKDDLQIRKFYVKTLNKYFIGLPEIAIDLIKGVKTSQATKPPKHIKVNRKKNELSYYNFDEYGKELTVEDLEHSKDFVISFHYSNTNQKYNIPIVMDDSKLFINVITACNYLKQPFSKSRGIYSVCNGTDSKSKYVGHKWRYAKTSDIDFIISQLRGN